MSELRIITVEELKEILSKHVGWLTDEPDGERADLRYANLRYANLRYADLRYADLRYANLRYANLRYADLRSADLRYANLRDADLRYADLRYANLRDADLRYADLRYANLILVGQDIRGYLFWAFVGDSGAVELRAGCRWFRGIAAMQQHWAERHEDDAILHEDCLSLVDRCERMAKVRGWKLEPEQP